MTKQPFISEASTEIGGLCRNLTIVLLTGLLVLSTPARAEYQFEIGHWYGQFFDSDDGSFESCVVSLHNAEDQLLLVRLDRDLQLSLGISNSVWNLELGSLRQVKVWLDHKLFFSGDATSVFKDLFSIYLGQSGRQISVMRAGHLMLFQMPDVSMLFELDDGDAALDQLRACVQHGLDVHSTI